MNKTVTKFALLFFILGIISLVIDLLELFPYQQDLWCLHLLISNGYPIYFSLSLFTIIPYLITSESLPRTLRKYGALISILVVSIYFLAIIFLGNSLTSTLKAYPMFKNIIAYSQLIWIFAFNTLLFILWLIAVCFLMNIYKNIREEEHSFFDSVIKK